MTRILFICVLSVVTLFSFAQERFSIKGIAGEELNGKKLYLYLIEDGKEIKDVLLDSVEVKKRKFSFTGKLTTPRIAVIRQSDAEKLYPLILEKGNITLDVITNRRGGTLQNDTLDAAIRDVQPAMDSIMWCERELRHMIEGVAPDQLAEKLQNDTAFKAKLHEYGSRSSVLRNPILQSISTHNNSLVGVYIFTWGNGVVLERDLKDITSGASSVFMEHIIVKKIIRQKQLFAERMNAEVEKRMSKEELDRKKEKAQMDAKIKTDERAPDAKVKDLGGKEISLTAYIGRGKYVLIDFWASWCGPCRREMPNVKAAYEKYASKGFEVVSISTDAKQKAWKDAIQELGMTWTQLQDVDAADTYGVYAIPTTFLVAPDGTIIAKNLRGKELEEELAKLF